MVVVAGGNVLHDVKREGEMSGEHVRGEYALGEMSGSNTCSY